MKAPIASSLLLAGSCLFCFAYAFNGEEAPDVALDFFEQADKVEIAGGTILLTGIDQDIQLAVDRPYHGLVSMPVTDFAKNWRVLVNSAEPGTPNVAIIGMDSGRSVALIGVVDDPKADQGNLTFKYTPVAGPDITELSSASLVIDNRMSPTACLACHTSGPPNP